MGRRRKAWWRPERVPRAHPLRSARARTAFVGAVLLVGTSAALPGHPALAAGIPTSYAFAPDASPVTGATSRTDAPPLAPGATYKSSLPSSGEIYYSLDLDATSDTYVSVTAVPPPGDVPASDGIQVSVEDAEGHSCSSDTNRFGLVGSARPIAVWAAREVSGRRPRCKSAGTYHVIVKRVATTDSAPGTWNLELFTTSEPRLKQAGSTSAPEDWNSATPTPLTGESVRRAGGSGFASAATVGQGLWSSDIKPGQSLFYKVPLDWGRQLYATAELGDSSSGDGNVSSAMEVALYNPARGLVDHASTGYQGSRRDVELDPLPPVAYENRYAIRGGTSSVRFAGSYYLVVHLAAEVAERYGEGPLGLTLSVQVGGSAQAGPDYAGKPEPEGVFEVSADDRAAVAGGVGGAVGRDGDDAAMTVLAVSGIGAGTVVLVVLGVWAVVARRRVGAW